MEVTTTSFLDFRCQDQVQVANPVLAQLVHKSKVLTTSSLGLTDFLEQLTELIGASYLLEQRQFIMKGYKMEKVHRAKHEKRVWSFYALSRHSTLLAPPCMIRLEVL